MRKRTDITKEKINDLHFGQNKSLLEIATIFNISKSRLRFYLKKFNIDWKRNFKNPRYPDLTGKVFGKLTVLKPSDVDYENNRGRYWDCECDCGSEKITTPSTNRLIQGKATSCGCLIGVKTYKGHGDLSGTYWGVIKYSAKSRDLPLEITIEEAWNLFLKQNKKCALSGIDIYLCRDYRMHINQTASLDRIDSSKPYTIDNVQWVHKTVNVMKMDMKDIELYEWAKQIYLNNKDKYESNTGNES